MLEKETLPVIIVGAGPVGLTLALDLAWRGIEVAMLEIRPAGQAPSVKCNHVSSRTMEIFRRLGIAPQVRQGGLPDDYPNDVVVRTRATGLELARIPIPCRQDRYTSRNGPDTGWLTPEPPHRINQIFLEPILFEAARRNPLIHIHNRVEAEDFKQDASGVTVMARNLDSGAPVRLRGQYLVGCDGGRSAVRRKIGARLSGDAVIQRVQSTYFRAPALLAMISGDRAWMSYLYNPDRAGNLLAIDGRETWLLHNYLLPGEAGFDQVDRDACLRTLLGVGDDFEYEVLGKEDWVGRRLVVDKARQGRVFICGDAAHLWVPYAGYGMNAGIADAMTLSWTLAAHLSGWAPEAILDAYERERLPITEQVSRFAMSHAERAIAERTGVPAEIEDDTPEGEAARQRVGRETYDLNVQQFACAGLNYGYYFDDSALIAYDGEAAPGYTMHDYTPSTVPGCRLPHLWLADGGSLYDALGPGYTMLRFDAAMDLTALQDAMAKRHVPFRVVDMPVDALPSPYTTKLVLARPDQHIAWRGDAPPADATDLADLVRGARNRTAA